MKTNRTSNTARDAQVIAGIEKHLKNVSNLPSAGSTVAPADLVKLLQSGIEAANATSTARAHWHATVAAERALNTKLSLAVRGLRQYVIHAFGSASPVLADFGFLPDKRATRTPEQKAAAAMKAKATRQARHTMGSVQKKAVKGDVTAVVMTPIKSAAGSGATPPPAPPAGAPQAATSDPKTAS